MTEPTDKIPDPHHGYEEVAAEIINRFAKKVQGDDEADLNLLAEDSFYEGEKALDDLAAATWANRQRLEAAAGLSNQIPLRAVDSMIGLLWGLQRAFENERIAGVNRPPVAVRYAAMSISTRSVSTGQEVQALLRAGLPNGARARWRTLYELAVIASVLAEGNRWTAARYVNHKYVRLAMHPENFIDSDNVSSVRFVEAQARNYTKRYGPAFASKYGWAAELSARRLNVSNPQFHHLEKLSGLEGYTQRKNVAHQLIHPSSLGVLYAIDADGAFHAGSDHGEIWHQCLDAVRILGDISASLARLWTRYGGRHEAAVATRWSVAEASLILQRDCVSLTVPESPLHRENGTSTS